MCGEAGEVEAARTAALGGGREGVEKERDTGGGEERTKGEEGEERTGGEEVVLEAQTGKGVRGGAEQEGGDGKSGVQRNRKEKKRMREMESREGKGKRLEEREAVVGGRSGGGVGRNSGQQRPE